jgi:hypothetical protein
MRRVAPSVIAREQLQELLAGGLGRESNIVSALVETVTRLVVQDLLEAEQADYLGGRGRYERRGAGQSGSRNGYESGRVRTAEGAFEVAVPQVRVRSSRFPPGHKGVGNNGTTSTAIRRPAGLPRMRQQPGSTVRLAASSGSPHNSADALHFGWSRGHARGRSRPCPVPTARKSTARHCARPRHQAARSTRPCPPSTEADP